MIHMVSFLHIFLTYLLVFSDTHLMLKIVWSISFALDLCHSLWISFPSPFFSKSSPSLKTHICLSPLLRDPPRASLPTSISSSSKYLKPLISASRLLLTRSIWYDLDSFLGLVPYDTNKILSPFRAHLILYT